MSNIIAFLKKFVNSKIGEPNVKTIDQMIKEVDTKIKEVDTKIKEVDTKIKEVDTKIKNDFQDFRVFLNRNYNKNFVKNVYSDTFRVTTREDDSDIYIDIPNVDPDKSIVLLNNGVGGRVYLVDLNPKNLKLYVESEPYIEKGPVGSTIFWFSWQVIEFN